MIVVELSHGWCNIVWENGDISYNTEQSHNLYTSIEASNRELFK